jgi:hypothetical protein
MFEREERKEIVKPTFNEFDIMLNKVLDVSTFSKHQKICVLALEKKSI